MEPLVSGAWLDDHVGDADLSVLDATVDLDMEAGQMASGRRRFATAMGALGVGDGSRVVICDARDSMWAARVWWLLRGYGFDEVAVLDGGLTAWVAEGRPVTAEVMTPAAATFTPRPRPGLIVGREEVRRAIEDPGTRIVDALSRREYRGELAFYGRPGHLAGAINVPARAIVDRDTQRYRTLDELRGRSGRPSTWSTSSRTAVVALPPPATASPG